MDFQTKIKRRTNWGRSSNCVSSRCVYTTLIGLLLQVNFIFIFLSLMKLVLVSIGLGVNVDRKPMLPMASTAIKEIFHDPVHPFWTGRAMDLLFDGIPLDCSSTNFNAKAICSVFETGEVQAITQVDANTFKFSFFGAVSWERKQKEK